MSPDLCRMITWLGSNSNADTGGILYHIISIYIDTIYLYIYIQMYIHLFYMSLFSGGRKHIIAYLNFLTLQGSMKTKK